MRTKNGAKEILLDSFGTKSDKVISARVQVRPDNPKEKENIWRVSYTNINGLMSKFSKVKDYLQVKKYVFN